MSEIVGALSVFGWGIMFGAMWAQRKKPKTTMEMLGELIGERMVAVAQKRQWVGIGKGFEVSSTMSFTTSEGRTVELVVREADTPATMGTTEGTRG